MTMTFGYRVVSASFQTNVTTLHEHLCLATVSNQPVVKQPKWAIDSVTGLATVMNVGVPVSATQDGVPRPMRISAGVNSCSNSSTACFSSQSICYSVGSIGG